MRNLDFLPAVVLMMYFGKFVFFCLCAALVIFGFAEGDFFDEVRKIPEKEESDQYNFAASYDFIVVGSGSAGSVVASRLSENPDVTVLLLEVGDIAHYFTNFPGIAAIFQFSNYNWGYLMEREDNICLGLKHQRCPYPRGKALGGSSIINYMIHVRGNHHDYDKWEALGNPGWGYRDVLPYFMKSEKSLLKHQDQGYHGTNGTLAVSHVASRTVAAEAFINAAKELGYEIVDYNGKSQFGFSYVQSTTENGERCSVEKAFLRRAKRRRNLKVSTRSRVTKVLIQSLKATGVEFVKDGKWYRVRASKEVILSAGAFHSPQLLMLSGIGPKAQLEALGIRTIKDLPVGKVMYDHVTFPGLTFEVNQPITIEQGSLLNIYNFFKYAISRKGVPATLGGVEALGYIKTKISDEPLSDYPDIELIFVGGSLHADYGKAYRKSLGITRKVYEKTWKPLEGRPAWSVFPMLLHPKSKGRIELRSKDPFDAPRLYGATFTDPANADLKTFVAAIKVVQMIANTTAFQVYGSKINDRNVPGCEDYEFDSDFYWECALRHLVTSLHHQIATCKMGPDDDIEAVVDHNLKVRGIGNLRVADASVIPITLSAHTNVPTIMIGEKAADIIKNEWGLK